jgi:hypothetical protein
MEISRDREQETEGKVKIGKVLGRRDLEMEKRQKGRIKEEVE